MGSDKILVFILGILAAVFIYWFFLLKKDKAVQASQEIDIKVHGGYQPSTIIAPLGKSLKLNFLRTEDSSCLEEVVLPDFKIRQFLPLNKKTIVTIKPERKGEYEMVCGMNMFHGKIIVK